MPQSELNVVVNLTTQETADLIIQTLESIDDIDCYEQNGCEIFASTKVNMKTFGDQIYINLTSKEKCTEVYIVSQTPGQLVDWGRNQTNIENIISPLLECENIKSLDSDDGRNLSENEIDVAFVKCPDCGKSWTINEHPHQCDVCGCPSQYFICEGIDEATKNDVGIFNSDERRNLVSTSHNSSVNNQNNTVAKSTSRNKSTKKGKNNSNQTSFSIE